jgi:hypothetical protein
MAGKHAVVPAGALIATPVGIAYDIVAATLPTRYSGPGSTAVRRIDIDSFTFSETKARDRGDMCCAIPLHGLDPASLWAQKIAEVFSPFAVNSMCIIVSSLGSARNTFTTRPPDRPLPDFLPIVRQSLRHVIAQSEMSSFRVDLGRAGSDNRLVFSINRPRQMFSVERLDGIEGGWKTQPWLAAVRSITVSFAGYHTTAHERLRLTRELGQADPIGI